MKQTWLVGAVASVLFVASAALAPAQTKSGSSTQVPAGDTVLGTVSIPRRAVPRSTTACPSGARAKRKFAPS